MANVFDQVPPTPTASAAETYWLHNDRVWGYSGFWWRVLAWLIDSLILSFATLLIGRLLGTGLLGGILGGGAAAPATGGGNLLNVAYLVTPADSLQMSLPGHMPSFGWQNLIELVVSAAYFSLLESSRWQATIGKRICRLRVTRLDGQRITPLRALARYFGKFLSALILCIGFLMIAWTRRKQGLHDLLADTLVVRLRPPSDLVRFNPPT